MPVVAADRGEHVLASVSDQYGMDADSLDVSITCTPAVIDCPSAGAIVTVSVSTRVSLPLIPAIFGLNDAASISVEGSSVQKVSRLWGSG